MPNYKDFDLDIQNNKMELNKFARDKKIEVNKKTRTVGPRSCPNTMCIK